MAIAASKEQAATLPGHLELPEEDGTFVNNFRELPQSLLLTDAICPVLQARHPDGHYAIGQDSGIYWRLTNPPLRGAVAPDWFYVPDVPPDLDGHYRRSYVLWKEPTPPLILLEFASGDGSEERDRTPWTGKFWIYEQMVRAEFYGIFVVESGHLEVFQRTDGVYRPIPANALGLYPIPPLHVALGVWQGSFFNEEAPWLRWFDEDGRLIPISEERIVEERRRADEERRRADEERRRADEERRRAEEEQRRAETAESLLDQQRRRAEALAARLRAMGIDPDEQG